MTAKPREQAVETANQITDQLAQWINPAFLPEATRIELAMLIDLAAIRPVADPLEKVLKLVRDECTYRTPAGTTNCRWCDNNMDHEGTYLDMHAGDCVIHDVHAALAAYRGEGK